MLPLPPSTAHGHAALPIAYGTTLGVQGGASRVINPIAPSDGNHHLHEVPEVGLDA
ncbi:hypothetical protein [Dyella monticola]|uniref:hypothetical protein n=1 Tax=Dyella monticola TaxID=1927958 RepID=UPI0013140BC9|nr:hypothetical protein [Dyella monticola]